MTVREYLSVNVSSTQYTITDYCGHKLKCFESDIDKIPDEFLNAVVKEVDFSIETAGYNTDVWIEATIEIEKIDV